LSGARRALVSLLAAVFAAGLGLAAAGPAAADPYVCDISGDRALCANVIRVDPGSVLNVRTGPGTNYPERFELTNGTRVGVVCWTEGTPVNGYNIWTLIDTGVRSGYVSDYYLSTGRVQDHLPHC
jgi:hypothetical protein